MSGANWFGLALGIAGAFGMWVAGKGRWQGWAVGLAIQPVWAAFFINVGSWTGLLVPALYGGVYARNLMRWRTEQERGGDEMGFQKHGTGEVLRDDDTKKTANKEEGWSDNDEQSLESENTEADKQ